MTHRFSPDALIFDMDGLLVDSEPIWAIAEDEMMQARGIQVVPAIQNELVGLRMREFLSGMRTAYGMTDDLDVGHHFKRLTMMALTFADQGKLDERYRTLQTLLP